MSLAAYTGGLINSRFNSPTPQTKIVVENSSPNKAKILLIEDCPFAQKINMRNLMEMGYEVDLAINGKEGLSMLSKGYDAVITDINMPEMDGITVIKSIRNSENNNQLIPIIVLSTETDEIKTQCLNLGADAAEDKSIKFENLEQLIKTLLYKSPKYTR